MCEWPAGSHLVMTTTYQGVELLAIGHKYNKRKVISFIATKGAGHTQAGVPYEARWKDQNKNTMSRKIYRPEIVSKYYAHCNKIDIHNQSRQFDLRLEKQMITHDGYLRIITTIMGITIVDAWKGYRHHLHPLH